jgi:ABC-2 type transport system ATP-binding protein
MAPLYTDLTVDEYLDFVARSRDIPADKRGEAKDRAVAECGLEKMRYRRIDSLSKGYKQRTGLAQAIIHDPPILILDEPTTGLDPNQIIEIRGLIKRLGKSKTVILSTHILQEVEAVCTQVLILNEGKIAAQGTPEEIAGTMKGGETWALTLKGPSEASQITLPDIENLATENTESTELLNVNFFIPSSAVPNDNPEFNAERIFDWAVSNNYKILKMEKKRLSLEDIFVKLTTETDKEGKK